MAGGQEVSWRGEKGRDRGRGWGEPARHRWGGELVAAGVSETGGRDDGRNKRMEPVCN
jgi:hypothetical protein